MASIFRIREMLVFTLGSNSVAFRHGIIVNTGWHRENIAPGILAEARMSGAFFAESQTGGSGKEFILKRVFHVYKKTVSIVGETPVGMYENLAGKGREKINAFIRKARENEQ